MAAASKVEEKDREMAGCTRLLHSEVCKFQTLELCFQDWMNGTRAKLGQKTAPGHFGNREQVRAKSPENFAGQGAYPYERQANH